MAKIRKIIYKGIYNAITFFKDLFNTRQYHCETASTAFLGLEFDASSHLFDNEHTDGQAQPDALGKLAALVETLEIIFCSLCGMPMPVSST